MFENVVKFFKNFNKKDSNKINQSKDTAKERLHLVLMQDRANVSADFLELMKQEIIDVIKKYIEVDEHAIDVRMTNKENGDGSNGAPALYANIPILNMKSTAKELENSIDKKENTQKEEKKNKEVEPKKENKKSSEDKKTNIEENTSKEEKKKETKKVDEKVDEKVDNSKKSEKTDSNKEKSENISDEKNNLDDEGIKTEENTEEEKIEVVKSENN